MAYEADKEVVLFEEEAKLENGYKIKGKVYNYNGGKTKFKIMFTGETKKGESFFTTKFPAMATKKDLKLLVKIIKSCEDHLG